MPEKRLLSPTEVETALHDLSNWEYRAGHLHREYRFADFVHAWAFMTGCAIHAQELNHHPNWSNVYSRVTVELFTHDAGGVTGLDLELARRFELLAAHFPPG